MGEQVISKMFALLGFKVEDKGLKDFGNNLNLAKLKVVGLATVFMKFANDTLKSVTQLSNFSKRTGISEEFAAEFTNIAKASNIGADTVLNSLETISEARQNFLRGEGNVQPWALLGVDITKNPEQVFKDILERIENIKDAGLRTKLLKDAGLDPQLVNMAQNKNLGTHKALNFKGEVNVLDKLNKEINIFKLNLTLLKNKAISLLTPFRFIVELINRLIYGLVDVIERTLGFNDAITALKIILVGLAVYLNPIIKLVVGIGLVIDDFLTFLRGGDSVIGEFIKYIKNLWDNLTGFQKLLVGIGTALVGVFAIKKIMAFASAVKAMILVLNSTFIATPLGQAFLAGALVFAGGKFIYDKIKKKKNKKEKEGEKSEGKNGEQDLISEDNINNFVTPPSIPDNLGNISNSNKTNNNNVQITNNMNISGNNAKEIADNIKEQEMEQLIDNMTMELN